jgi:hypothetical protein
MKNTLVHPKLMNNLYRFFPKEGNVERGTIPENDLGDTVEDVQEYSVLHEGVRCRISSFNTSREGDEIRRRDKTIVLHPYGIVLKGVYDCKESDRFTCEGKVYDILGVDPDSENSYTRLITEIITI